ncbi:MAG: amino acid ABC transporter substrate-binding protein [Acidimicrobiia bacterium]
MTRRLIALVAVLAMMMAACTEAAEDPTTTAATDDGTTATSSAGTTTPAAPSGDTLAAIQERGALNCGVNPSVPGFGFTDADGNFSGFDIDFCKALATAVFGDPEAVEYVPLDAAQRFTALGSGEIDVLIRNTTWTASRDGGEGATFLTTTFYDGQGMMVRADSGFETIEDMADVAVCVLTGTTTELNLATRFGSIPYTPQTFDDNETLQAAFIAGQCDGWTSDKSQLAGVRSAFPEAEGGPDSLVILDETFSKEPLGPAVRDGDSQWAQIVDWVVITTIAAEELGIESGNIDTFADSENLDIRRMLGLEITADDGTVSVFDAGLGLEPGWPGDVIAAVGNYAEIYERNVAPLGVPRGPNSLYVDGGLLYAPPFR